MEILTAGDLGRHREELEEAGANLLGKLMFAFGRLEHALSLAVRSVEGGKYLKGATFNARLDSFQLAVAARHEQHGFDRGPYDAWIERAHRIRQLRNDMVHGRWVADPLSHSVVNVITSADLTEQWSVPYLVSQLEALASEVAQLQVDLGRLVMRNEL